MMDRNMYAKLDGEKVIPCSMMEWHQWNLDRRVQNPTIGLSVPVAKTDINKDIMISTVFLGINHGWGERDLWFETMIFGGDEDGYQERYATWEEAEKGHSLAMTLVAQSESQKKKTSWFDRLFGATT